MGAIAPIDFEKSLITPNDFHWKQGLLYNLHPLIEIPYGILGILHPSIEISNDAPVRSKLKLMGLINKTKQLLNTRKGKRSRGFLYENLNPPGEKKLKNDLYTKRNFGIRL